MTAPITCPSSKMVVKVGDGGSPEIFAAPCGMNTKGLNFTKATNEIQVPDCDDPDAPAWIERSVTSMSAEITENGILAMEAHQTWRAFKDTNTSRNVQIWFDLPLAQHGGYYQGKFHLTGFNLTGELGNKVQAAVTMLSDGAVVWHDAAA